MLEGFIAWLIARWRERRRQKALYLLALCALALAASVDSTTAQNNYSPNVSYPDVLSSPRRDRDWIDDYMSEYLSRRGPSMSDFLDRMERERLQFQRELEIKDLESRVYHLERRRY